MTIIPPQYYYDLYMQFCLFLTIFTLFHTVILKLDDKKNISFINVAGYILLLFILLYMGLRPVEYSNWFGDMVNYKNLYYSYVNGKPVTTDRDFLFHVFTKFCSQIMPLSVYFGICTIIYVYPLYRISKNIFKEYWYYCFLLFLVSVSFWTYGVNGMRNGMATSIFLLGISFRKKIPLQILFFLMAFSVHKSTMLPILGYTISIFFNKPKVFIYFWLVSIPLSLILGGFWESFFGGLGFADERLGGYLTGPVDTGSFRFTGFRWDFLLYGAGAVFTGWYFIFKKKFKDKLYNQLFITYTLSNAFWILVIRANFSNRFAYLSWFMMAIVIIYPLLKQRFFENQHIIIGRTILIYFSFTYFMYLFYS